MVDFGNDMVHFLHSTSDELLDMRYRIRAFRDCAARYYFLLRVEAITV
jgi:hypothetical protein